MDLLLINSHGLKHAICALISVLFYLIWAGKKVKKGEKGEEEKYNKLFEHLITT